MFNVGCIAPEEGYLEAVRELCDMTGTLLVFDEVKTAVTVAHGGCEQLLGVRPDLKVVGKGIAGGVPCAAVLGPRAVLAHIESGSVPWYSTFAGNALAVSSALAALELLDESVYDRFDQLNALLRKRLEATLSRHSIPGYVVTWGAKGSVIFASGDQPLRDVTDLHARADSEVGELYWVMMMNRGILLSPGQDEQWTLSIQHDEQDVEQFCLAFEEFAKALAPRYAKQRPSA